MLCGVKNRNDAIWWRSGRLGALTSDHYRSGLGDISVRHTIHVQFAMTKRGRERVKRDKRVAKVLVT